MSTTLLDQSCASTNQAIDMIEILAMAMDSHHIVRSEMLLEAELYSFHAAVSQVLNHSVKSAYDTIVNHPYAL